jgi:short-subunit dehydrogenase involved in D-alanine esterification of teichoic acids
MYKCFLHSSSSTKPLLEPDKLTQIYAKMAPKILDFKCALITGGGGGLGYAMAEYFVSQGKKVIIAGHTESTL